MLVACGGTDPQTTQGTAQTTDTGTTDTGDDPATTGSPTTGTNTGSSGGATSTGTSTGPVESTGGEPTSTGDTSTTTDTSTTSTTDASTTASTTGEPAGLTISLEDVQIYANCQPFIEADPLHGQWTTVFDNSLGEADMATLVAVTFMIAEGDPPIAVPWEATPNMSGPIAAGAKLSQPLMKIKGSPYPACDACGKPFSLQVDYTLGGGAQVGAQAVGNLECVY